jgi:hypothetical protein
MTAAELQRMRAVRRMLGRTAAAPAGSSGPAPGDRVAPVARTTSLVPALRAQLRARRAAPTGR